MFAIGCYLFFTSKTVPLRKNFDIWLLQKRASAKKSPTEGSSGKAKKCYFGKWQNHKLFKSSWTHRNHQNEPPLTTRINNKRPMNLYNVKKMPKKWNNISTPFQPNDPQKRGQVPKVGTLQHRGQHRRQSTKAGRRSIAEIAVIRLWVASSRPGGPVGDIHAWLGLVVIHEVLKHTIVIAFFCA